METDTTILDGENYRNNGEGQSFKEICLQQLGRVVRNLSQEMRAGFWIHSQSTPQSSPVKIKYIGDSRKETCNSINCLHDLLLPKFDKDAKDKCKTINEEIEKPKEAEKEKREYWSARVKQYRKLFQELCLLLERLGWLEGAEASE